MITIALDEQGNFESLYDEKKTGAPIFIGGLVFDELGDEREYDNERRKISFYLQGICEEIGGSYPSSLHSNGRNNAEVAKAKTLITETLPEFMKTGRCKKIAQPYASYLAHEPERQGKYHFFANMVCDDGSHESQEGQSIIVREDYASNLYMHMAENIVERLIFHNPIVEEINRVHLELATRVVKVKQDKRSEYRRLGYIEDTKKEHHKDGEFTFFLTTGDNYRTAIDREMQDTEKWNIKFDAIVAKSIFYGRPSDKAKMEFLYMADIVCSVLGFRPKADNASDLVWEIKKRADFYTGHNDNLIFVHDSVDIGFRKAWAKFEDKDYYEALCIAYETMHKENPFVNYYKHIWFSFLEEKLQEESSLLHYKIALEKLYDSTRQNNLNQEELFYIFSILNQMKENIRFTNNEEKAVLYKLYDTGVSAYCHIGQAQKAVKYFEKCKEYAPYVSIETYIRTRNKLSVCLSDAFCFEEAKKLAEENKEYCEKLMPLRSSILKVNSEKMTEYGITCSQLGQAYAFLRDKDAEKVFLQSLEQMLDTDSPNYLITLSYLLHFYLDMGMKEEYEQMAERYFNGNPDLQSQLYYILDETSKGSKGRVSMKFALYIFVRSVYQFYMDDVKEIGIGEQIIQIEEAISKEGEVAKKQIVGHPWEIIYKYLALIAYDIGEVEKSQNFIVKMISAVSNQGMIIDMICWFGQIEYYIHTGDRAKAGQMLTQPPTSLEEDSPIYALLQDKRNVRKIYDKLNDKVFTFMYR